MSPRPITNEIWSNLERLDKTYKKENLVVISVHVPRFYLKLLDDLVELGMYPNRSEAIRIAIRDMILKEKELVLMVLKKKTALLTG